MELQGEGDVLYVVEYITIEGKMRKCPKKISENRNF